ncbi:hypothetical protein JTB14_032969 [Gonioctena quinquepunctata]|nr:hypothetical protein JTB14_032969 [Gonioctena quinquepunctata]
MYLGNRGSATNPLVNEGYALVDWAKCWIRDHVRVVRCYNCQKFGHLAGASNIDVTIVNRRAYRAPHTWKVLEDQIASDHRLIITKIGWDPILGASDPGTIEYNVRRVNLEKLNQLGPGVELRLRNQRMANETELKQAIQD